MKTRYGFISNSSSTSFMCPACGNDNFGWDWDDDPICNKCGCHIADFKEPFSEYLIAKYKLNREEELESYIQMYKALHD